ncbi:MAG: hypothetical protein J1E02_07255 [Coprobacter sp.]|nr:hypothetical protein [Coprobacter sp.]
MNRVFFIMMLMIMAVSCQSISNDPIKGANDLSKELQSLAIKNDCEATNELLSKYLNAYQDKDKIMFLLALRDNLMANDRVVNFIADADFHEFPMLRNIMKELQQIAFCDAINEPNPHSPASKGIMFVVMMADYAKENNIEEAYNTIVQTYKNLQNTTELSRIEFFASFKQFMQASGNTGKQAFRLLNQLNSPEYIAFQKMALESWIDYEN